MDEAQMIRKTRELYYQAARQACPHCGWKPRSNYKYKVHEPTTVDHHGYGYISQEHRCWSCTITFWPESFKVDVGTTVCPICNSELEVYKRVLLCSKCGLFWVPRGIEVD